MEVGLIVTILIAVAGWAFAIWQMRQNRKWQQRDKLADRRYEAYSKFLVTADSLSAEMKKSPQKIMGQMVKEFLSSIMADDADTEGALIKFNTELTKYLGTCVEPMCTIKQELSALKLVASPEMLELIDRLQFLTDDLYNDFHNCLAMVNVKNTESFQQLNTMGQDKRYWEYGSLYEELTKRMREEIQIK